MNRPYSRLLPALLALLMLSIAPFALAQEEAPFNSMAVAAYATKHNDGTPQQLRDYVQPIDITWTDGAIKVHLIDAIFVDSILAIAWTVENTGDTPLYMMDDLRIAETHAGGYTYHGFGSILEPGETRNCGRAGQINEEEYRMLTGDTQTISLAVAGLRLLGEPIDWSEVGDGALYENDRAAYEREVDRLFAEEGKIVIEGGGYMAQGNDSSYSIEPDAEVPYDMYPYINNGRLSLDSRVSGEAQLRNDHAVRSILPDTLGEMPYGEGTMRLTRADLSPGLLVVEAIFTFPDEQTAVDFHDPDNWREEPPLAVVDARGVQAFYGFGTTAYMQSDESTLQTAPQQQEDGTYSWTYRSEHAYLAPPSDAYYVLLDTSALPVSWTNTESPITDFSGAIKLDAS